MAEEYDNRKVLLAIIASISEYAHLLGQPATLILSSLELLNMPGIDDATRKLACETSLEAALEIKAILGDMKRKCSTAEEVLNS